MKHYEFEYLECDDMEEIFRAENLNEAKKQLQAFCEEWNEREDDYLLVKISDETEGIIWKFGDNFPKDP